MEFLVEFYVFYCFVGFFFGVFVDSFGICVGCIEEDFVEFDVEFVYVE